jgi:hypothetical protein
MEASFGALRLWLDSWKGIGDIEAGARAIREERDVEAVVEDLLLLRSGPGQVVIAWPSLAELECWLALLLIGGSLWWFYLGTRR